MPTFATPNPITASVEIVSGAVHVVATDRDDTVVTVSPRDPNRASDVRIADGARVDFANGTLTVSAGRRFIALGRGGSVVVDIELPSRSRLEVSRCPRGVRADGDFGDCRFSTVSGDANVESVTGNIKADSASGGVAIETGGRCGGHVDGVGRRDGGRAHRRRQVPGRQRIAVGQRLRGTSTPDGVRRRRGGRRVTGGVSVQTGSGDIEVGVAEGTAARLDLRTHSGNVRNDLRPADGPADGDETLTVHVRTGSGDISVQRATAGIAG